MGEIVATAEGILSGEMEPYRGAAHIWRLLAEEDYRGLEHLRVRAGLAGEWQDHSEHRGALEADIRDEARLLLERGSNE